MLSQIAELLIRVAFSLAGFFFLVRFLLQLVQADFYNPVSQMIVKVTEPVLRPLRNLLPSTRRFNTSAILLALLVEIVFTVLILALFNQALPITMLVTVSVAALLRTLLTLYLVCAFGVVIVSWIAPNSPHPVITLMRDLIEPLAAPIRRLIPPLGGVLDLSMMIILLGIIILRDIVLAAVPHL